MDAIAKCKDQDVSVCLQSTTGKYCMDLCQPPHCFVPSMDVVELNETIQPIRNEGNKNIKNSLPSSPRHQFEQLTVIISNISECVVQNPAAQALNPRTLGYLLRRVKGLEQ